MGMLGDIGRSAVDRALARGPRPSLPPGGGCDIERSPHSHWCGHCELGQMFTVDQCRTMAEVPKCRLCQSQDWRSPSELVQRMVTR